MKEKKSEPAPTKTRKPYGKPTVTKLTHEQAKLKLFGEVSIGNEEARKLLEEMFHDVPLKNPKKSA